MHTIKTYPDGTRRLRLYTLTGESVTVLVMPDGLIASCSNWYVIGTMDHVYGKRVSCDRGGTGMDLYYTK